MELVPSGVDRGSGGGCPLGPSVGVTPRSRGSRPFVPVVRYSRMDLLRTSRDLRCPTSVENRHDCRMFVLLLDLFHDRDDRRDW